MDCRQKADDCRFEFDTVDYVTERAGTDQQGRVPELDQLDGQGRNFTLLR